MGANLKVESGGTGRNSGEVGDLFVAEQHGGGDPPGRRRQAQLPDHKGLRLRHGKLYGVSYASICLI